MASPASPSIFVRLAEGIARQSGRPASFILAAVVALWAITGPLYGFSDSWQLVINTCTSVVTFLMVFLIQNSQNRESAAVQIKLDEFIRAVAGAHNALLDIERLDPKQLETVRAEYAAIAERARRPLTAAARTPTLFRSTHRGRLSRHPDRK